MPPQQFLSYGADIVEDTGIPIQIWIIFEEDQTACIPHFCDLNMM